MLRKYRASTNTNNNTNNTSNTNNNTVMNWNHDYLIRTLTIAPLALNNAHKLWRYFTSAERAVSLPWCLPGGCRLWPCLLALLLHGCRLWLTAVSVSLLGDSLSAQHGTAHLSHRQRGVAPQSRPSLCCQYGHRPLAGSPHTGQIQA